MGGYGVYLDDESSEVTNLRVRWNRLDGIFAVNDAIVSNNTVYENGGTGIFISSSTFLDGASTITGNTVFNNGGTGISGGNAATITGNTCVENGLNGIVAGLGSYVVGNTVRLNGQRGLAFPPPGATSNIAYRENTITNNALGTVFGGFNAGDNSCNGTLTCP